MFLAFIAYVLFRLVFDFIIPIYRTTKQVKKSFREMRQKMNEPSNGTTPHETNAPKKKEPVGDYIDFEDVKD
jgi:hypothetical protein